MSLPSATGSMRSATATAAPPLVREGSYAQPVVPNTLL